MKPSYDSVACERFAYDFGLVYSLLYESDASGGLVDYGKAVGRFDELFQHEGFKSEVRDFGDYMGDFLMSDREAAAFVLALKANGML